MPCLSCELFHRDDNVIEPAEVYANAKSQRPRSFKLFFFYPAEQTDTVVIYTRVIASIERIQRHFTMAVYIFFLHLRHWLKTRKLNTSKASLHRRCAN